MCYAVATKDVFNTGVAGNKVKLVLYSKNISE